MIRQNDQLLTNLKKLQDFKFEIYIHSQHQFDFHDFGLYTVKIDDEIIDLTGWFKQYEAQYSIDQMAELVVAQYHL